MLAAPAGLWQGEASDHWRGGLSARDPTELVARLLAAPAAGTPARAWLDARLATPVDWPAVLTRASAGLVTPALGPILAELGVLASLPEDARAFLRTVAALNRERNVRIMAELDELAAALALAGIKAVALKGAGLVADGIFRTPACRMIADIDLLVPGDRVADALATSHALGWRAGTIWSDPAATLIHPETATRSGAAAALEIHVEFLNHTWRRLLPAAAILADAVPLAGRGDGLAVPSLADRLVIVVAHAQLRDFGHYNGILPLRAVLDWTRLQARATAADWAQVEARFERAGLGDVLDGFVRRLERIAGISRPAGLGASLGGALAEWRQDLAQRHPSARRAAVALGSARLALSFVRAGRPMRAHVRKILFDPAERRRRLALKTRLPGS